VPIPVLYEIHTNVDGYNLKNGNLLQNGHGTAVTLTGSCDDLDQRLCESGPKSIYLIQTTIFTALQQLFLSRD